MILHLVAFVIFFVMAVVVMVACFMAPGSLLRPGDDRSLPVDAAGLRSNPRRWILFAVAASVTLGWVLIAGSFFGKSITGYGDPGLAADGQSYRTKGNPTEPIMFASSGAAFALLIVSLIWAKRSGYRSKWANGLAGLSIWILMANFLAYCLGCTWYEAFLKR